MDNIGPKVQEVTCGQRKLRKEKPHSMNCSPPPYDDQKKKYKMGGVYAMENKYIGLVRKPERKSQTDRPKHRWDANIKTDIIEAGKKSVDWIHPAYVRGKWSAAVTTIMNCMLS